MDYSFAAFSDSRSLRSGKSQLKKELKKEQKSKEKKAKKEGKTVEEIEEVNKAKVPKAFGDLGKGKQKDKSDESEKEEGKDKKGSGGRREAVAINMPEDIEEDRTPKRKVTERTPLVAEHRRVQGEKNWDSQRARDNWGKAHNVVTELGVVNAVRRAGRRKSIYYPTKKSENSGALQRSSTISRTPPQYHP